MVELANVGLGHPEGLYGGGERVTFRLLGHLGDLVEYGGEWLYPANVSLPGEGGGGVRHTVVEEGLCVCVCVCSVVPCSAVPVWSVSGRRGSGALLRLPWLGQ